MRRDTEGVRSAPRSAVSACVLAVAIAASGTVVALSRGAADSGIRGRIVPCGIVLERPAPCSVVAKPVSVVVGHGNRVVRRATVRKSGRFRVRLGAGHYWLQPPRRQGPRPARPRDRLRGQVDHGHDPGGPGQPAGRDRGPLAEDGYGPAPRKAASASASSRGASSGMK